MKDPKNQKNEARSFTPGKNNYVSQNESASPVPKAPEKRISFKKGIVLNCFYIMETFLASKLQQQIKNISRKTKTNYFLIIVY